MIDIEEQTPTSVNAFAPVQPEPVTPVPAPTEPVVQTPEPPKPPKKGLSMEVWGAIGVIILIILFGGLYFINQQKKTLTQSESQTNQPELESTSSANQSAIDPKTDSLKSVSSSTTTPAIQKDINNTDLNGMDNEMDDIDREINSQ